MSPFEAVTLKWDGATYVVPANRVMGAIARIEQHVTLSELLTQSMDGTKVKMSLVAMAYASVLRYAGASVADEDVYAGMFSGVENNHLNVVQDAIVGLLSMMVPSSSNFLKNTKAAAQGEGERRAPNGQSSSQERTEQPEAGDSPRSSSGDSIQLSSGGKPN